jgi:uroporphyrinogen decarboxylase
MKSMSPRERVLAPLNHGEPDRVPVDIGGGASASISAEAYEGLKRHLGVQAEPHVMSKIYRVALLDEVILQRLKSDCRPTRCAPKSLPFGSLQSRSPERVSKSGE